MATPTGNTHRVFVSHSHHDSEFCERLVHSLKLAGLDVWLDDQNLGAGHLPRLIEAELRSRDTFIVVFSPAALTSQWVESEWYAAWTLLGEGKVERFIPLVAEACEVPMLLRGQRWIDFARQPFERGLELLFRALQVGPGATSLAATPPQPRPGLPLQWSSVGVIRAHTVRGCFAVAWSPDGRTIASGSYDRTVCLWDASPSHERRQVFVGHNFGVDAVAWSPDGRWLASASTGQVARIWDVASGQNTLRLEGHTGSVVDVAWSPDGRLLATASADQTARIWEVATGKCLRVIQGHGGALTSVAWSPDGQWLGTTSRDATIRIWRSDSGAQAYVLAGHSQIVYCVRWSPDGQMLASSGHTTVRLWDARSGNALTTLHGHSGHVLRVAWRPDGSMLASASADKTVMLWDTQAHRPVATLGGHTDWVHGVDWSPDGMALASCGGKEDGTIRVWAPV